MKSKTTLVLNLVENGESVQHEFALEEIVRQLMPDVRDPTYSSIALRIAKDGKTLDAETNPLNQEYPGFFITGRNSDKGLDFGIAHAELPCPTRTDAFVGRLLSGCTAYEYDDIAACCIHNADGLGKDGVPIKGKLNLTNALTKIVHVNMNIAVAKPWDSSVDKLDEHIWD